MAVTPDKVQIGTSQDYLDGVAVDTSAGTGLFRETVVLADPENGGGLANVKQLGTQITTTDKGIVTNTVIHGMTTGGGGGYVDVKVNPSGALVTDASGSSVNVSNFPATQAVSGTVTANLGTLNGAATAANQTTSNNSLASLDGKIPDLSGTWFYDAGTSGTLTVSAGRRILQISATAGDTAATMTINGGATISIPAGRSLTIEPKGNLTAPTIVFAGTTAYFVEEVN